MQTNPQAFIKEWRTGRFHPAYYFFGEENAVSDLIAQLKTILNPDPFNFSEFHAPLDCQARSIVVDALTPPAFAVRRLIIVDNAKIPVSARAEFIKYLEDPLETTTLVFRSDEKKIDPKDRLSQAVSKKGALCLLRPLREDEVILRLQELCRKSGKTLSPEAAFTLVNEAGTDWPILRQELDKAALFAGDSKEISRDHILECLGFEKSADPWALPRLIANRALKECLVHLGKMFAQGKPEDSAFKALSQITSSINKQLRAKRLLETGTAPETLFKSLRLNSYYDRDFPNSVKPLTTQKLRKDLETCLETEVSLKSKAWLDPRIELEQLVIRLCQATGARSRPEAERP